MYTGELMSVRVRFAPSPTGQLHVGNVRTALYSWLFGHQNQGSFVLRIEDTDISRSEKRFEEQLIDDLSWLGLTWNEGVSCGGEFGPYRQSDRGALYQENAQRLVTQGKAYYCFCPPKELENLRQQQQTKGQSSHYTGKCRKIPPRESKKRIERRESAVLRLKVREGTVDFEDMVFGKLRINCNEIGDFVLLRPNGTATYNFACTVDDLSMQISHVIRGEGHISNTYRQILIYEALESVSPRFAHLSTVLGKDGTKLSKRHGATSVEEFRQKGYLPQALLNYLALLGWAPSQNGQEILTLTELITQFDLGRVHRSPATFDPEKLNWVNRSHLKSLDRSHLVKLAIPHLRKQGWLPDSLSTNSIDWIRDVVEAVFNHLFKMEDLIQETSVVFDFRPEEDLSRPEAQKILSRESTKNVIEEFYRGICRQTNLDLPTYKKILSDVKRATGQTGRTLFQPVRLAMTARISGPELDKLIPILEKGKELNLPVQVQGVEERVKAVLNRLQ